MVGLHSIDPELEAMLMVSRRRRELAASLAAAGGSVRFQHHDDQRRQALAGPDMAAPGMFRLTRFDERGPVGHTQYNKLDEATLDALREGYSPQA